MSKTLVVAGFGPGISNAVAERFGRDGFAVALLARREAPLAAGAESLGSKGVAAAPFVADAGDPASVKAALAQVRERLGPVSVLHWNAIGGLAAGDLMTAGSDAVRGVFDVAVTGLLSAVRELLPDLKAAGDGAVLVTNGAYGELSPMMDAFAVNSGAMGLAVANAAKHKLVGLLAQRLKADGVQLGEVMVAGAVRGTASDNGSVPTLDPAVVAEAFWRLYQDRTEIRARVG